MQWIVEHTPKFCFVVIIYDTRVQLILFNKVLNQLQNWILRESIFSYGFQWSTLELLNQGDIFVLRILGFRFISVHKCILIKMYGCTRSYELTF